MPFLLAWLLHGIILAALVRGALRFAGKTSAATRYAVAWAALAIVLALPAALLTPRLAMVLPTFGAATVGASQLPAGDAARTSSAEPPAALAAAGTQSPLVRLPNVPDWLAALAIGLWLGVVSLGLFRITLGVDAILRLKASSRPFPAARARKLTGWRAVRRQGRLVELRLSDDVASASFLGLTRPVIAISPALAASLTDEELDLTVLHEFAHVQRWDDWSKLAQLLVMAVCGWHPGVRLLDRTIDLERESACDDWVVRRTGSARGYARCLVKIVQTMPQATTSLVPGAYNAETPMETRVKRLLDAARPRHAWAPLAATATTCAAAAVALMLTQLAPIGTLVGHAATVDDSSPVLMADANTNASTDAGTGAKTDAVAGSNASAYRALPLRSASMAFALPARGTTTFSAPTRSTPARDRSANGIVVAEHFTTHGPTSSTRESLRSAALTAAVPTAATALAIPTASGSLLTSGLSAAPGASGASSDFPVASPAQNTANASSTLPASSASSPFVRTLAPDAEVAYLNAGVEPVSTRTRARLRDASAMNRSADAAGRTVGDAAADADDAVEEITPQSLQQAGRSAVDTLSAGMRKTGTATGDGLTTAGVATGEGLKQAGLAAGDGVKSAGLATGDGVAHAGIATGHAASTAAVKTGSRIKKSSVSTGRALAKVGGAFKIF